MIMLILKVQDIYYNLNGKENDLTFDKYPFEKSFEEMVSENVNWLRTLERKIEEIKNKKGVDNVDNVNLDKMEKFNNLVGEMSQKASELLNLYEELNGKEMDMTCDNYPFQESFDEIYLRISSWKEGLREEINKKRKKKKEKTSEIKLVEKIIGFLEKDIVDECYDGDYFNAIDMDKRMITIETNLGNIYNINLDERGFKSVNPEEYYYEGIRQDFINKFALTNPNIFARFVNEMKNEK